MASIFEGTTTPTVALTSKETPSWMQDAIYNQLQQAALVSSQPYQAYTGQTVAPLSQAQQQAHGQVQTSQGAWMPSMNMAQAGMAGIATSPGGYSAALPFAQTAAGMSGVAAAQPYLQAAGQSSTANIDAYMNPFVSNVTDQIAKLGARNLSENLLPAVSDSFVRAGQFGGSRMGEFGSRALRDTQEAVLGQQANALQQGYGQALTTSGADLSRQAGLAGTAGNLAQGQQSALTALGGQLGGLAQGDIARSQSALTQIANLGGQSQDQFIKDTQGLSGVGQAQQAQQQAMLNAQKAAWEQQQAHPMSMVDWYGKQLTGGSAGVPSTTTSTTTTGGVTPSPLSQAASAAANVAGIYDIYKNW